MRFNDSPSYFFILQSIMNNIKQDIKTGEYKRVYLIYGTENYLKKLYADKLRNAVTDPSDTMNSVVFQGDSLSVSELTELCDTMPFFVDRRFILVNRSGLFKAKRGESEEGSESDSGKSSGSEKDKLTEYIKQIPDTTVLVFVEDDVDKRSRLFKAVKETGYETEIKSLSENDMRLWIGSELKKCGKSVSGATADYLVNYVGTDMEVLAAEIQKLALYAYDRNAVTNEDVKAVCTKAVSAAIFDMTDALAAGQIKKALDVYEELLGMREPVFKTFYSLLKHFTQLYVTKEMMSAGAGKNDIVNALGAHPFVCSKLMGQAGRFSLKELREKVDFGVTLECDAKSGRLSEKNIVELFVTH